MGTENYCGID